MKKLRNPFPVTKGKQTCMGRTTDVWQVGTWNGPAMWFCNTEKEARELSAKAFAEWRKRNDGPSTIQ